AGYATFSRHFVLNLGTSAEYLGNNRSYLRITGRSSEDTMHDFHAQISDFSEFGMRFTQRAKLDIAGGVMAATARTKVLHQRTDAKGAKVDVTPADQVAESIKDGKINKHEAAAFDKTAATRGILKDEQARLREAVQQTVGDADKPNDT